MGRSPIGWNDAARADRVDPGPRGDRRGALPLLRPAAVGMVAARADRHRAVDRRPRRVPPTGPLRPQLPRRDRVVRPLDVVDVGAHAAGLRRRTARRLGADGRRGRPDLPEGRPTGARAAGGDRAVRVVPRPCPVRRRAVVDPGHDPDPGPDAADRPPRRGAAALRCGGRARAAPCTSRCDGGGFRRSEPWPCSPC